MKIILNKKNITKILKKESNLGFVPTMGGLHKGHVSLIKKSKSKSYKTIVSIFVNKAQFGRKSDYKNYPRSIKKDISILKKNKVDYLFLPKEKDIYPFINKKRIKINSFEKKLCGKFRPGHFKAVVDVVHRFINIIKPKIIYLGEKDMQQLKLIEDFINKNKIKCKVVSCKTIRENNGVACSSRNFLLSSREILTASKIYKIIRSQKKMIIKNNKLINSVRKKINKLNIEKIDYLKLYDINKLIRPFKKKNNYKIFIAYYLGPVRLIDNI